MHLNYEQINQVCSCMGLGEILRIEEIDTGFSNDVFDLDNKFILKSWDKANIHLFKKELWCLNKLKGTVPVPRVICSDDSGSLTGQPFIIMEKLPGTPLIGSWQHLNNSQRAEAVKQICSYLRIINTLDVSEAKDLFHEIPNWQDWVESEFRKNHERVSQLGLLDRNTLIKLKVRFEVLLPALREQNMKVSYYDVHFGNFLIEKGKICGMIDLERVEWVSIDYSLNWVNRMSQSPEEYLEEPDRKQFQNILSLFSQYFKELFEFERIEERLEIYTMLSDLRLKLKEIEQ